MVRTSGNSTRSVPLAISICAVLSVIFLCACFAAEHFLPTPPRDLVAWVDVKAAIAKAKALNKPILYDFSAEWCGPCKLMRKVVFSNKQSAKFINNAFIPVQVIDREREDGVNPMEIETLQKKYHITAFPTLVVAAAGGLDVEQKRGYGGKEKTTEFLTESLMQRTEFGRKNSRVAWKSLDDQITEWPDSKKPLLVLCWNDEYSTSRKQYLSNQELNSMISKNFLPVELAVPIRTDTVKSEKAKALLKILEIKKAPAMVIVPADGSMPHFQIGDTEAADNLVFLRNYLRLSQTKQKVELPIPQ